MAKLDDFKDALKNTCLVKSKKEELPTIEEDESDVFGIRPLSSAQIAALTTADIASLNTASLSSLYNIAGGGAIGGGGGGSTYTTNGSSGGGTGAINSIYISNAINTPTWGNVTSDINVGGRSLSKVLEKIEQRLCIIEDPDPRKLEQHAALKKAYEHYKMLEKLIGED